MARSLVSTSECDLSKDVSGDTETVPTLPVPDVHVDVDQAAQVVLLLLLGHGLMDAQPPVVHLHRRVGT